MAAVRVHVFISGAVQGVSFRYYTRQQAEVLGLSGWVRNKANGRVEAVFEGEKEKVAEMIVWCKEGSPSAKVENVEVGWEKPESLEGFDVLETI